MNRSCRHCGAPASPESACPNCGATNAATVEARTERRSIGWFVFGGVALVVPAVLLWAILGYFFFFVVSAFGTSDVRFLTLAYDGTLVALAVAAFVVGLRFAKCGRPDRAVLVMIPAIAMLVPTTLCAFAVLH